MSKNGRSSQLSQKEARSATEQVPAAPTLRLQGSKEISGFLDLGRKLLWHRVADRLRLEG